MGQAIATTLVHFGWLAGLTLNYSSMSTVVATIIVMLVVLPQYNVSGNQGFTDGSPDIERKWKLPEPEGDVWHFNLPFTVLEEEALGLNVFMRDYFEAHADESASDFYTDQVAFSQTEAEDSYQIGMMVWLAPYDLGVSQSIQFVTSPVGVKKRISTRSRWMSIVRVVRSPLGSGSTDASSICYGNNF